MMCISVALKCTQTLNFGTELLHCASIDAYQLMPFYRFQF